MGEFVIRKINLRNKSTVLVVALCLFFSSILGVTVFGVVRILEAGTNLIHGFSTLQDAVNGAVFKIDPIRSLEPVHVPLGYLDDSGKLSGPIVEVIAKDSSSGLTTAVDITRNTEGTFLFEESAVEFKAVNVYYHIIKMRRYLLGAGLDQMGSAIGDEAIDPTDMSWIPLSNVIDKAIIHESAHSQPGDKNLYFSEVEATDSISIYEAFAKKVYEPRFLENEYDELGRELLRAFALYHAYSAASALHGSDIFNKEYLDPNGDPITTMSVKNNLRYDKALIGSHFSGESLQNILAIAGALWDIRENIPTRDANTLAALAPLTHKKNHGPEDLAKALLNLDRVMFNERYRQDINTALVAHGIIDTVSTPQASNSAPSIAFISDQAVPAGSSLDIIISVSDSDQFDAVDVVIELASGDPLPGNFTVLQIDENTYELHFEPSFNDVGSYFIKVLASDWETTSNLLFTITVV